MRRRRRRNTKLMQNFKKHSIGGVCYPPVSSPPQTSAYTAPQLIDRAKRDDTAERVNFFLFVEFNMLMLFVLN